MSGKLTLDDRGNADAAWLFQAASTLITFARPVGDMIDTGASGGIYWDVGSSATLGTTTSFERNILADASITLGTGSTIGCGGVLAHTSIVTVDANTIDATDCADTEADGSNGLSGGLDVAGTQASFLPFAPYEHDRTGTQHSSALRLRVGGPLRPSE